VIVPANQDIGKSNQDNWLGTGTPLPAEKWTLIYDHRAAAISMLKSGRTTVLRAALLQRQSRRTGRKAFAWQLSICSNNGYGPVSGPFAGLGSFNKDDCSPCIQ
jgi:hypothetical protein